MKEGTNRWHMLTSKKVWVWKEVSKIPLIRLSKVKVKALAPLRVQTYFHVRVRNWTKFLANFHVNSQIVIAKWVLQGQIALKKALRSCKALQRSGRQAACLTSGRAQWHHDTRSLPHPAARATLSLTTITHNCKRLWVMKAVHKRLLVKTATRFGKNWDDAVDV